MSGKKLLANLNTMDLFSFLQTNNIDTTIDKEKIIKATLSSEDGIADIEKIGKVKKLAFPEVIISVPRAATAVAASELLQNFPVDDLTIEEIPIEDVIRKVFRGGLRK